MHGGTFIGGNIGLEQRAREHWTRERALVNEGCTGTESTPIYCLTHWNEDLQLK